MTFMDENGEHGAVLDGEAARSEDPVVAARGLQLGRVRQPEHAGPRRHGHLHGQARLRLDLQPDRQHGRADRVRVDRQHHGAAVQSEHGAVQAGQRDGRARRRASNSRSPTPTSSSRRSGAPASASTSACRAAGSGRSSTCTARTSTASTTSTPTCRTRTRPMPAPTPVPGGRWAGRATASTPTVANAVVLKNQNVGTNWNISGSLERTYRAGLYVKGGYRYGARVEHGRPGLDCVRLVEQQPALGQPEQPGRGVLGIVAGPPRLRGRQSTRFEWLKALTTSVSVFFEGYTNGNTSYTFSGDAQRRRRHEQRPDLHRARPVGDELPDVHVRGRGPSRPRSRQRPGTPTSRRTPTSASTAASTRCVARSSCRWCSGRT